MMRLWDRIVFAFVCLIGFILFGFAATRVSGIISSDTTWTPSASPYIVTGNILANSGIALTIEPRVIMNVQTGKALQISGTINARGINSRNVTFAAYDKTSRDKYWGVIQFSDGAGTFSWLQVRVSLGHFTESTREKRGWGSLEESPSVS
jgi:hypothetical protein